MSHGFAHKPTGWSPGSIAVSQKAAAHESRASFRPAVRPGRRAVAAGLDTQDLAENQGQTRKSGPRRRERQFVEVGILRNES